MMPPGVRSTRLLVLIDLSWWLTVSWHAALSGALRLSNRRPEDATDEDHRKAARVMISIAVGWLGQLLTPPIPACIAVALDSIGPTFRHGMTEHLPAERRYKANRSVRPYAYKNAVNLFLEILSLHGIPLLSAETYEADDVIATATVEAMKIGLDVAIVSGDKDLGALVQSSSRGWSRSVWQWAWSGKETANEIKDQDAIEHKFGVLPWMIPDLLAILGDTADNVPGVDGIGDAWGSAMLLAANSEFFVMATPDLRPIDRVLRCAIAAPPDDAIGQAEKALVRLKRARVNTLSDEAIQRREEQIAEATARLSGLRHQRDLAKRFEIVQRNRENVLLARELVTLRNDAPLVGWDPDRLPVGGFDVETLRDLYRAPPLEFHKLAAELVPMRKLSIAEILR